MLRISLLLFFGWLPIAAFFAQCPYPSNPVGQCGNIAPSGGLCPNSPSFFCEGEVVCVENNMPPGSFDQWQVIWDDGTCDTYAATTFEATHTYIFPDSCLLAGYEGFNPEITLIFTKFCANGISRSYIKTPVLIKVNPVAKIIPPQKLCVGQEACFLADGCENADTAYYEWYFDGVFAGIGLQACITFTTKGWHTVQHTMTNECGSNTVIDSFWVKDIPKAVSSFSFTDMIGCTTASVELEDQSLDATSIGWSVLPMLGATFTSSYLNLPDTMLQISEADTYVVQHIAENICGADTSELEITTHDVPLVTLAPELPACDTFDYTPVVTWSGSIDSVMWFLNDSLTHEFFDTIAPTFHLGGGDYEVRLVAIGRCGADTVEQQVIVNAQVVVNVEPVPLLCQSSDSIPLIADQSGVEFSGGGVTGNIDSGFFFDPAMGSVGSNTVNFFLEGAGDCDASGSLDIEVLPGAIVTVLPPFTVCRDAGLQALNADPPNGEWTGEGVVSNMFDPLMPIDTGTYELTYQYTDPSGCLVVKTTTATVVDLPSLQALDTVSICAANEPINLVALTNATYSPDNGELTCVFDGVPATNCQFNPSQAGTTQWHEVIFTYTKNGCDTTLSTVVEITPLEIPIAEPDFSICKSEGSVNLDVTGVDEQQGTWSGDEIEEDGTVNLTVLDPGTYEYVFTHLPGTPCEETDTVLVTVEAGAILTKNEDWVCETQTSYTLPSGTPTSGDWEGLSSNVVNISPSMAGGSFPYTYTVDSLPDACESDVFTLHVQMLPEVGFTHPPVGCKGIEVCFENITTGATHFEWHFGDANNSVSTEEAPCFIYPDTGTFIITLEAWTIHPLTGLPFCASTQTSIIHISEPPQIVDFKPSSLEGCAPFTVTFENLSQGENMQYHWEYDGPDIIPPYDGFEPPPVTFLQKELETTFYTVTLTAWNDCETIIVSKEIAVLPRPSPSFGYNFDEPCSGGTLILGNTSTGNPEFNTWTIFNTVTNELHTYTDFSPPPINVFTNDTDIATVIITLHVENPCGDSVYVDSVHVFPTEIDALFNYSALKVCKEDTLFLTNHSTPGTIPSWKIVGPDGVLLGSFLGDTVIYEPPVADSFKVILYADGCGYDSMEVWFEVLAPPELSVTFDTMRCAGQSVKFEVFTNGSGHELHFGDNTSTNLSFGEHLYDTAGIYSLHAIAQTPLGCSTDWLGSLEVFGTPEASILFTDSICANVKAIFNQNSIGAQTYDWNFGDSSLATGDSVSHAFETGGIYDIELIATSEHGCRYTTRRQFFVRPTPDADFAVEVLEKCTPAVVLSQEQNTDATGQEWQFSNGLSATTHSVEATIEQSGVLEIMLIATHSGICFDTARQSVTIFESPNLAAVQDPSCTQEEGTTVTLETDLENFVKMTGVGYDEPGTVHEQVQTGDFTAIALSSDGCETSLDVFVPPVQELIIYAEKDTAIEMGEEAPLKVISNQPSATIAWSPAADVLGSPSVAAIEVRPMLTTFYAVAVTNELGCIKYDTVLVRVNIDREKNIFVPNTFTPNNDGANDLFRFRSQNPGLTKINFLRIYDRWGELVFEANNFEPETAQGSWDGTFREQKCEMGMYLWTAELFFLDGVTVPRKGGVTLIQ